MKTHNQSEDLDFIYAGSERYINTLGLFRTLYKLKEDPSVIAITRDKKVKVKVEGQWTECQSFKS